ncbi:competence type IV pilus minor pilin ComGD [Enterococcus wangshanyuanii]|uniref:Competence protein ComYD n=1 Tax=Enterococcus wangshanyuanii TaxID=2005703 RepID=A0ABQ1P0L2_9ENTE|nr:competence type IV pilus minor pilin ComGD [Enterococcus wangshanyuanii]GGC87071.1 competence protein ComYD [Enterococcus wangshanyuanii]
MKRKVLNGFTLIESLIVVFVCTFFMLLPVLSIERWQRMIEIEQFLSTFEKQLLFTQQMAIVKMTDTQIVFEKEEQQLYFVVSEHEQARLSVPEGLNASGPNKIVFKAQSGNNGKLAKFTYDWSEKQQSFEFQFQLGSGRYVKKINQL